MSRIQTPVTMMSALLFVAAHLACSASERDVGDDRGSDADSDSDTDSDGDGDGDSDGGPDGDSDGDSDGDADGDADGDTDCFEENFKIEIVPTRVMILMDISSSMTQRLAGEVKWNQSRDAIIAALTNWLGDDGIEFGFDFFPNHKVDNCATNEEVPFDVTPLSAEEIIDFLDDTTPAFCGGATPLCAAMEMFDSNRFADYAPVFTGPDANRYLVIVTDGNDMCGNNYGDHELCMSIWPTELAAKLLAQGIKSYTIGYDEDAGGALDEIAAAGGTGQTEQILVSDGPALETELEKISQQVVSCTFELKPDVDVDTDEVNLYADGAVIPFDEGCANGSGWDWVDDAKTQAVLCEEMCTQLQEDEVETVKATFGCPTTVVV